MHIHSINMPSSYNLCPFLHSHIKPHTSCTEVPTNSTKQSGRPQDAVRYHILRYHIISSYNHDTYKHAILLKMHNIHSSSKDYRTKALTSTVTLLQQPPTETHSISMYLQPSNIT